MRARVHCNGDDRVKAVSRHQLRDWRRELRPTPGCESVERELARAGPRSQRTAREERPTAGAAGRASVWSRVVQRGFADERHEKQGLHCGGLGQGARAGRQGGVTRTQAHVISMMHWDIELTARSEARWTSVRRAHRSSPAFCGVRQLGRAAASRYRSRHRLPRLSYKCKCHGPRVQADRTASCIACGAR